MMNGYLKQETGKRVCMIVMSLYPNDERVRREAAALERSGVSVDVICQRGEGEPPMERFGNVTAWRVVRQGVKENLVQYLWVASRFMLAASIKLHQLSLTRRFHVIQAHNMPDFLIFAGALHKLTGTPLVLDLHDLSVELYRSKWLGSKGRVLLPLVGVMEKLSCRLANRLITTSSGFKGRLVSRGIDPGKVELVLNAPDPRYFQFQAGRVFEPITSDLRLFYHGTVAERFGLAEAIEAVALLRPAIPGTTLTIHGKFDPAYRARLEALIESRGLRGAVTLGGWLGVNEIAPAIREADIGIVPYLRDEFMSLALSTKTFEYAATGLPVAASRLDSIEAHFDDESVEFFEPGSPREMAERIASLARDPARRRAHVAAASLALEKVSGAVMEERYLKLMRGLMGIPNGHD